MVTHTNAFYVLNSGIGYQTGIRRLEVTMNWSKDWYWSDTWGVVGVLLVIVAVIAGGVVFFAPKNVDYYYISRAGTQSVTCVYAHWTWHPDEIAFCTDDGMKATDFAARANASIKNPGK
jgi:hypothetical protein